MFIFSFSSRSQMATQTKETSRAAKFVPPTVLQRPALGDTDTQKQTEVTKTQTVLQVAKETTSEVSLIIILFVLSILNCEVNKLSSGQGL